MNEALTEAIKEAYAICPSGQVVYDTLEIRQDGVQDRIYMVRSRLPITALDEDGVEREFGPVGFQFTMPSANEDGFQSLNVGIDNVGRRISDFITTAKSQVVPVAVIYRPYLSTDLSQPQMNPPLVLYLKDVQLNNFQVTGRAVFMDIVNRRFPSELYTRSSFPGLG